MKEIGREIEVVDETKEIRLICGYMLTCISGVFSLITLSMLVGAYQGRVLLTAFDQGYFISMVFIAIACIAYLSEHISFFIKKTVLVASLFSMVIYHNLLIEGQTFYFFRIIVFIYLIWMLIFMTDIPKKISKVKFCPKKQNVVIE